MTILTVTIWVLLITSWLLPKRWFKNKNDMYSTQVCITITALILMGIELANLSFKWF